MSFKEVGDPHRPLVVSPKVSDGAVDGRVRQHEYSFLFHSLEITVLIDLLEYDWQLYAESPTKDPKIHVSALMLIGSVLST